MVRRTHPLLVTVISDAGLLEYVQFLLLACDVVEVWFLNAKAGAFDRAWLIHWLADLAGHDAITNARAALATTGKPVGLLLTVPGVTRYPINAEHRTRLLHWLTGGSA